MQPKKNRPSLHYFWLVHFYGIIFGTLFQKQGILRMSGNLKHQNNTKIRGCEYLVKTGRITLILTVDLKGMNNNTYVRKRTGGVHAQAFA